MLNPEAGIVRSRQRAGSQVRQFLSRWDQHLTSWCGQELLPVLLLHYEGLLADPELSRHPEVCAAELDGEVCLFQPETAQYLNLNPTASAIWRLLENPLSRDALVTALMASYMVEETNCRQETEAFLAEALAASMLLETEAP